MISTGLRPFLITFLLLLSSGGNPLFAYSVFSESDSQGIILPDTVALELPSPQSPADSISSSSTPPHSSIHIAQDTPEDYDPDRNWWHLLKKRKLNMADTTVQYPRFLQFCVNIYNWADKTFNSYDPEYVVGTGKRWKARVVCDNWSDYYSMRFDKKMSMRMLSDLISNVGPYLQYMAVSVGYSYNLNHAISGNPIRHKRMDFGFNCARFNIDLYYITNSGTQLRQFNSYKGKKVFKSYFPGVDLSTFGVDAYYFLNNRKYSQGAAYNFSKIQKKSAGSFIVGFTYSNQDISLDFSTLDPTIKEYFTLSSYFYKFHYNNYCLILGYGYNFVLNPHLLFNITIMPNIGFNHCYEDSTEGAVTMFSLSGKGRLSLTYNLKNFFAGLSAKADSHWYNTTSYSLFNSIFTFSASAGIRF
ncbi:MAG: DUF4421 domain-containing protein [Muribaculaceae bacterium]|nr:DUF4421 domain-containing protein [Muribaculaceae bacterium]